MKDNNFFREIFNSSNDYHKIILSIFIIKKDYNILNEARLYNELIEKLYKGCTKIINEEVDDYNDHNKNLEESVLKKLGIYQK